MIKFGISDSLVVPLALPGSLLTLGLLCIGYFAFPNDFIQAASAVDAWASGDPKAAASSRGAAIAGLLALAALLLYLISIFLGAVVAVLAGYVEGCCLDWLYPRLQKNMDRADFDDQWSRYVDHVEVAGNTLVAEFADLFLFQLRSSVALLLLFFAALGFGWCRGWPESLRIFATVLLACAVPALLSAVRYHWALASYRKDRFGKAPVAVRDALELVSKQISAWCGRESLKPLAILLPVWIQERKKETLQALSEALAKAVELDDPLSVYSSEKETLRQVKNLLDAQVTKL